MSGPAVWGVDVSTHYIDLAVIHQDGSWRTDHRELYRTDADPGHGLQMLHGCIIPWLNTKHVCHPCSVAYVELPIGRHASPRLMMTAGLLAAAIAGATGAPTYFMPPPKWKKAVGLKGNCGKPEILHWARERGYRGARQDGADALGLAQMAALDMPGWVGASPPHAQSEAASASR